MLRLLCIPLTGFMASIVSGYLSRRVEFMLVIVLATRFVIYLSYEPSVRLDWLKVKVEDK